MRKTIRSFQGLRALAFLGIFLFHCWHPGWSQLAMWGVSFFFILSGFLTGSSFRSDTPGGGHFMFRRMKKTYWLHIATIILCIPVSDTLVSLQTEGFSKLPFWMAILMTNVTLTKSFLPKYYFSFNGLSWFLSTYAILSLVTPFVGRWLQKRIEGRSLRFLCVALTGLYVLGIGYSFLTAKLGLNVEYWNYICPLAHVFDYGLALTLGLWLQQNKNKVSLTATSRSLLQMAVLAVLAVLIFAWSYPQWLCRSILWVLPNVFLICLFVTDKGALAPVFGSRLGRFLGKHSANMFLIHQIIWRYFDQALGTPDQAVVKYGILIIIYGITLALSLIWEWGQTKIHSEVRHGRK